jgi:hypothetical protein
MKHKKYFIITLLVTMISMWALVPPMPFAKAFVPGTIADTSALLSDSDLYASSSITVDFTTSTNTPQTGFWRVEIPVGLNNYDLTNIDNASVVCAYGDGNFVASTTDTATTGYVECIRNAGGTLLASTTQIKIYNIVNPDTAGVQYIQVRNFDNISVMNERVKTATYIIDDVIVTATVDSSLSFSVDATTTPTLGVSAYACNDNKTGQATATSVPFGTLDVNDPDNICQELNVTTNAQDGYIVTIEQDHVLLADSGATIDSFRESGLNTGTTTPEAWVEPSNTLDYYNTYGHMGITTDDDDIIAGSGLSNFNDGEWFAGMNNTDVMVVMDHDGPTDGYTPDVGVATIMFRAHIMSLQEAGDYTNTVTYICTPTF